MRATTPRRTLPQRLLLASFLLLEACTTVGPDFVRPEVPWLKDWSSSALRSDAPVDQPRERAPTEEWWRNFNDPVLDRLVAEAQRQNIDVRIAGLRILEARAQLGIAGSALYPQLQQLVGETLRAGQQQSNGPDSTFWSYRVGLDIGWEIDFWGKFRRGIESADAAYFASVAAYDDSQVLVAAQAASFYATIRTIEQRLRIAHENAALQKRSLEITERLFKSGNESELDVQQARTQYLSTVASIPELEGSLRQVQNALNVLLARPPGPLPELEAGREKIPTAELAVIVDLPAELLRRRPDVRAAEMRLAAQSAQIGVSEAALYPSISLIGTVGLSASSLDWSARTFQWGVGPILVWNIFDWGRLKDQVLVQDARFQQLYEQYQGTVLRAARELDDAATDFATFRAQVDILRDAVQAARRSLDIANIQYREGLVGFERVLDSQRSLFSQQERLVSTQGGVTQSLIAVYKAMGGGWQAARAEPIVDEPTRAAMSERSDWKGLIDAPLPPANAEFFPPGPTETP
jgi:NodT family efflux transporter outer membrane factor (OMF) lipoprotein